MSHLEAQLVDQLKKVGEKLEAQRLRILALEWSRDYWKRRFHEVKGGDPMPAYTLLTTALVEIAQDMEVDREEVIDDSMGVFSDGADLNDDAVLEEMGNPEL